ncbi:MAG: DUF4835 family protein [Prevotellaceae bacterium]|jgi:hypothetical protein|nr:DUF4835 family protein [Prevotellaceae bacterium]
MLKYLYTIIFTILFGVSALAQELKCNVTINSSKIQGTNKSVFTTLQTALNEFMNGTKWTNNAFSDEERIECSFFITINEYGGSKSSGTLQVQARRPVYGTSYQTIILNHVDDDFSFDYIEFDRLDFDLRSFKSNLTSMMAFYAYLILGIDYDSFSLKGGSQFFDNAQMIISYAQKEGYSGWNPYENANRKNRYWIIENILSSSYSYERNAYYKYHRLGLDQCADNLVEGRKQILQALSDIQRTFDSQSEISTPYLRLFFDAKSEELVNIFVGATQEEKSEAYALLTKIDSFNPSKYRKITRSTDNMRF